MCNLIIEYSLEWVNKQLKQCELCTKYWQCNNVCYLQNLLTELEDKTNEAR